MNNVIEAQLEQDSKDHIFVRIVPDDHFGEEDKARLVSNIREHLGDSIKIDFLLVDTIPRTKTGKFRYVISHVNPGLPGITQPGERKKDVLYHCQELFLCNISRNGKDNGWNRQEVPHWKGKGKA